MAAHARLTWLFLAAFCTVVSLTGCQKYRAENSLKKTQQVVSDIEQNYEGARFEPQRIDALRQSIAQAQGLLETDASQALSLASQARTEADLLLEQVRPRAAGDMLERATREIQVADVNQLNRSDSQRYD